MTQHFLALLDKYILIDHQAIGLGIIGCTPYINIQLFLSQNKERKPDEINWMLYEHLAISTGTADVNKI